MWYTSKEPKCFFLVFCPYARLSMRGNLDAGSLPCFSVIYRVCSRHTDCRRTNHMADHDPTLANLACFPCLPRYPRRKAPQRLASSPQTGEMCKNPTCEEIPPGSSSGGTEWHRCSLSPITSMSPVRRRLDLVANFSRVCASRAMEGAYHPHSQHGFSASFVEGLLVTPFP